MATTLSAKKRIRQNVKCRARNRWRRQRVKDAVREFEQALASGDTAAAAEKLRAAYRQLDKVATTSTMHKNTASRKKARLARQLSKAAKK